MWRALAAAAGLVAVGHSPAQGQAVVTVDPPELSSTLQSWLDQSRMPTPPVDLRVRVVSASEWPCGSEFNGCATWSGPHIVLRPVEPIRRTFLHEVGHQVDYHLSWVNFDRSQITDAGRSLHDRFVDLLDMTPLATPESWFEPRGPTETFAEAFADCAEHSYFPRNRDPKGSFSQGYEFEPGRHRWVATCELLAAAFAEVGWSSITAPGWSAYRPVDCETFTWWRPRQDSRWRRGAHRRCD